MMVGLGRRLGECVLRYRWLMIVGVVLFSLWAASGARFLTFSNDSRIYFSKENPQLLALEALENTFSKEDHLLFVLAPHDHNVFTRKNLAAVLDLTKEAWQIPFSSRVNSIANFQDTRAADDELIVEDLVPGDRELSDRDLAGIRKTALSEPILLNRLISPQGQVAAVSVLITKPGKSLDETTKAADFARRMAKVFREKHPGIDLYLTGGVMIDNAFGQAAEQDMKTLVPLMYVVLLLVMVLTLRSIWGMVAALLVIVFSMITALGLAGWLGIPMSPSTVNAPTIILTLAVADSVHLLLTTFHLMQEGKSRHEALVESIAINLQAITLTSVTTAIGFLSMNYSDAPPFRALGNIVAIGVLAAWVYALVFLPAFVSLLPIKGRSEKEEEGSALCRWIAETVIRYRHRLFWGILACTAVISLGLLQIELNDDFVKYFDHRYDFRVATDFAEKNLLGFNVIEYKLDSGQPGGINEPAYLETLDRFTEWYRHQPKVANVLTYTDVIKRLNRTMHNDDPAYYRIPEKRDLAAQYLLLYEMSLPFGHDLNNTINVDRSSTRMVVSLRGISSRELRETDAKARQWLQQNAPASMFTYGSGLSVMFAHISKRNIHSMLWASFGALFLISMLLIAALRSIKIGLVSLAPNLTPALIAFGLWGHFVGQVGLVISILASMTLGIVVDDTIHFLSKYLHARREKRMTPEDAVRYAFKTVGTALWVTSVILVAGFLVLAFSGFKINSDMGLMSAITILIALFMDYFFLPSLVLMVEK